MSTFFKILSGTVHTPGLPIADKGHLGVRESQGGDMGVARGCPHLGFLPRRSLTDYSSMWVNQVSTQHTNFETRVAQVVSTSLHS